MVKGLNDAGFDTVISQPDIVEIQLIENLPGIFIVYLEGDINAFNGTLKYLTKIISESADSHLLYLIGNQIELDVAKEVVPVNIVARDGRYYYQEYQTTNPLLAIDNRSDEEEITDDINTGEIIDDANIGEMPAETSPSGGGQALENLF